MNNCEGINTKRGSFPFGFVNLKFVSPKKTGLTVTFISLLFFPIQKKVREKEALFWQLQSMNFNKRAILLLWEETDVAEDIICQVKHVHLCFYCCLLYCFYFIDASAFSIFNGYNDKERKRRCREFGVESPRTN